MYLLEHGSPVENSPTASVVESWHFSLLALPRGQLKCPVLPGKGGIPVEQQARAGSCVLHLRIDQELWKTCHLPQGNVKKCLFLMFLWPGTSVVCCFHTAFSQFSETHQHLHSDLLEGGISESDPKWAGVGAHLGLF